MKTKSGTKPSFRPIVDNLIDDIVPHLEKGDIIVDAGNSYWGDSIRRHGRLAGQGIHFVDLGTSGGVEGARHGACFMAGGDRGPIARIEPLLLELAALGGCSCQQAAFGYDR
jgi:6-phosphogluconate dehydrogenase